MVVEGNFQTAGDVSELSGIDCLDAAPDGSRLCLVVDDEARFVQFATYKDNVLTVGAVRDIFQADSTTGMPPHELDDPRAKPRCSKGADSGEVDGEAVAHSAHVFYVVGSHGCSKKKKYRPETFVLSRITVDDSGRILKLDNSYRLSEAILGDREIAPAFAADLPARGDDGIYQGNGTSIEGMTVAGDSLVLGFRSPAANHAVLLSVPIAGLFDVSVDMRSAKIQSHFVDFGDHIGFRDLERLPDGRFVALVGPDGETTDNGPYALRIVNADFSLGALHEPVTVPPGGSPEAIEWLAQERRMLVISDEGVDGAPFTMSADIPN